MRSILKKNRIIESVYIIEGDLDLTEAKKRKMLYRNKSKSEWIGDLKSIYGSEGIKLDTDKLLVGMGLVLLLVAPQRPVGQRAVIAHASSRAANDRFCPNPAANANGTIEEPLRGDYASRRGAVRGRRRSRHTPCAVRGRQSSGHANDASKRPCGVPVARRTAHGVCLLLGLKGADDYASGTRLRPRAGQKRLGRPSHDAPRCCTFPRRGVW